MARFKDREKAIKLRLEGRSYSDIKNRLGIGKGTLSVWLRDYPLSSERIKALRDHNPRRIENFRNTMRKKREARLLESYTRVKKDMSPVTRKDLFMAGFFLYWAEGTKTGESTVCFANTDPAMLKFFIAWLKLLGVGKDRLKARLHLYSDMNIEEQTNFWSRELGIHNRAFRKPHIKRSKVKDISYKGGFGHGTCNVIFGSREMSDYVSMGIQYLRDIIGARRLKTRP